jgi:methyl-accepting chemotaxis protein
MQKEMSNQEEMMKQSIEEMRATQEQMQDQESELKQINLDIKENQRQLESRINILNEMCLVSVTDKKGVITEVNGKFLDIAKYSEEELIGKPHNIVRHPDMPAEVFKLMWSTIGKGQSFRGMVKNKAKDGSAYWVDAVIKPIIGDDGKPVGYIGVRYLNTDIIQKHPTYTYDLGDVQLTIPTA